MPEPTRQYIFTEGQIRLAFVGSIVGMVGILVLLLILVSARPQGRYAAADTTQFDNTLQVAIGGLEGYEVLENGRATIDIQRAMELVVERGVSISIASASDDAAEGAAGQPADEADGAAADGGVSELPDGSQVYAQCAGCHQQNGQGVPGAFPPLAGHVATLYDADGGRTYLIDVLLYGLQGPIDVNGTTYNGLMPAWQQLSDDQIAAVLNHIATEWGNEDALEGFEPYGSEEVEAQRGRGLTPTDVHDLRGELGLD